MDPTGEFGLIPGITITLVIMILLTSLCNTAHAPGPNDECAPDTGVEAVWDFFFMFAGAMALRVVIVPVLSETWGLAKNMFRAGGAPKLPTEPGEWLIANERMSPRSALYQSQVTGRAPGEVYKVGNLSFDGFRGGKLLEAKGQGYGRFAKAGRFHEWFRGRLQLINQANRQIAAANGTPIEWHIAEPEAYDAIAKAFEEAKVDMTKITLVHTPAR
jgi:hypothetical protein